MPRGTVPMALGKRVARPTCARAEILGCCSLPHAAPHSPQKSKLSPAPSCPLCVLLFDRLATSCQRCVQKLWPCHRANCMYLSVASTRARPGSRPALAARPCRTRGRARAQPSLHDHVALVLSSSFHRAAPGTTGLCGYRRCARPPAPPARWPPPPHSRPSGQAPQSRSGSAWNLGWLL